MVLLSRTGGFKKRTGVLCGIRTVSKKRLDYYRDEGIYYKYLKLTSDQLDLIDEQVIKLCGSIYIKK